MSDLQRIARQVLMEQRETQRLNAVQRRQDKDQLERYEAELRLIGDDLVQEGFVYGSNAFWTAAIRTLTARHLTRGEDELEARMRDTSF
jgi:hypothetical protein